MTDTSNPYAAVVSEFGTRGIRAEFHRFPDQLVLPSRIGISWKDRWYVSTWLPVCYAVPPDVDVVELCQDCVESQDNSGFDTIPDDVCQRYALKRISNEEFEGLFPYDEGADEKG